MRIMVNKYIPSIPEQIDEHLANIQIIKNIIADRRGCGDTERLAELYADIDEERKAINELQKEQALYNARVGFAD